jgi:hypothetical protein
LAKANKFSLWVAADARFLNFDLAARAILKLSNCSFAQLIVSEMSDDMQGRLIEIVPASEFAKMEDSAILNLLLSEAQSTRRATAIKASTSLPRTRVRRIFNSYWDHEDGRYYLVTHWLDLGLAMDRPRARLIAAPKT